MKVIGSAIGCLLLLPIFVIAAVGQAFGENEAGVPLSQASPSSAASPDTTFNGDRNDLAARVLANPRIHLSTGARGDVQSGRADPRILQVLLILADRHDVGSVGPIATGHSYFVKGTTRVSNHVYGRAVDIGAIDGRRVEASNDAAYDAARTVAGLPEPLRPSELGGPWRVPAPGVYSFTNESHKNHLHVGYDS